MTSTQSEVSALLDSRSEAARSKDIDQLMSLYSPGIIYFDVVPPLQYVGSDALRGRFLNWFDGRGIDRPGNPRCRRPRLVQVPALHMTAGRSDSRST